jgi:HKD family nuclease
MASDVRVRFLQAGQGFVNEIRKSILEYKEIQIAVAFVKEDGLNEIFESLKTALSHEREIKFIVGASSDLGITDSGVLERLLKLKNKHDGFLVRFYNNPGFHPKLFIFRKGKSVKIIVGSSNLTGGGVEKNVEANLVIETTQNHKIYQTIISEFDNWYDVADELDDDFVKYYKRRCNGFSRRSRTGTKTSTDKYRTPLPTSASEYRIPVETVFWKIAPGPRGEQWELWEREIDNGIGIIAIGWEDLNKIVSLNRARAIQEINKIWRDANPTYIYKQGKFFYHVMKEKDVVVAYSRRTIFGIGELIGEAFYEAIDDWDKEPYPNRWRVKWLWLGEPRKPPKKIANVLSTYDTIHRIEDKDTINYIKRLIRRG